MNWEKVEKTLRLETEKLRDEMMKAAVTNPDAVPAFGVAAMILSGLADAIKAGREA